MFVRIWRYTIPEAQIARFEQAYRSDGEWARLFARDEGFLGTELLRGETGAYLTIDRWRDESDWRRFMTDHRDAYRALDLECESLTLEELEIGGFSLLS